MTMEQLQACERKRAYWVIRSTQEAINAGGGEHIWLVFLRHLGLLKPDTNGEPSWSFHEIRRVFGFTVGETMDLHDMFQRQRDLGYITTDETTDRESWTV